MNEHFKTTILKATGANDCFESEVIQELWSGYGQIIRVGLRGSDLKSVVVKHVAPPKQGNHPKGWNTNLSHIRKLKSYEVESNWYKDWSSKTNEECRLPKCLALEATENEFLMVLEDMDASGFPERLQQVDLKNIEVCLSWLANFHAIYLNEKPDGLWDTGTYWHLETRPDELEVLEDLDLKNAALAIDQLLAQSPFQTFVHGDAKLANFCFSADGSKVSAVDFQYVGGGCGMKDLAYFVGSCLHDDDCETYENHILDFYFKALKTAVKTHQPAIDFEVLETNWRSLYPVAWADFHRFLKGWSPGHWKLNSYSERMVKEVLQAIK